jgi:hypothetical protein
MRAIDDLLKQAKRAIADGEASLKEAAECISKAQARGATQRQIAEAVGKSAAWVNRLLAWRAGGFIGDAFGPAHHKQRQSAQRVHPGEQRKNGGQSPRPLASRHKHSAPERRLKPPKPKRPKQKPTLRKLEPTLQGHVRKMPRPARMRNAQHTTRSEIFSAADASGRCCIAARASC